MMLMVLRELKRLLVRGEQKRRRSLGRYWNFDMLNGHAPPGKRWQ